MSDPLPPDGSESPKDEATGEPGSQTRFIGPIGEKSRPALVLRSRKFRNGREDGWRQLETLVTRVEKKGISSLSANEVERLPLLYRATMSSLSVARNTVLDRNLLLYLESLGLRAYLTVYGPRTSMIQSFTAFLTRGFPSAVRDLRWFLLAVVVLEIVGTVAGYALVRAEPGYFSLLVPESLAGSRGPGSTHDELSATLYAPWPGFVDTFIVFASELFNHNSLVALFSFGLGFALAIPTIILILYNALILGAFLAVFFEKGLGLDAVAWLSIHGVTELTAFALCGAAGLVIGYKIVFPGELSRLDSLTLYGRKAATVAAGAVLMLLIAGILEGGFRQLINNIPGRLAFASITAAFWWWYFSACGKEKPASGDTGDIAGLNEMGEARHGSHA